MCSLHTCTLCVESWDTQGKPLVKWKSTTFSNICCSAIVVGNILGYRGEILFGAGGSQITHIQSYPTDFHASHVPLEGVNKL
jgi:hypothetical protein